MEKLILDGENLTVEGLYQAAVNDKCVVEINEDKWEKITACRAVVDKFYEDNRAIYGVTTSCGGFVNCLLPKGSDREFQENLVQYIATQVGVPFPDEIVRGAMIARVNSLCRGYSGIKPENLKIYLQMINKGVRPLIPQKGSLGTSGDLGPLGCIASVAIGKWKARLNGVEMSGKEAMDKAGIETMKLNAKEGLSLVNGTSCMCSVASFALHNAIQLIKTADCVASLSMQTLLARKNPLDLRVHRKKYHPGQYATARNVGLLVEKSNMILDEQDVSDDLSKILKQLDKVHVDEVPVEDAYSLRAIPQVFGPTRDQVNYALDVLTREINSSNDNPLIFTEFGEGEFIHNAHFHGQYISLAMDSVAISIAALGVMSDRRVDRFMDEHHSNKLPAFLTKEKPAIRGGLMAGQYMTASLVAENRTICVPACIQSVPTTADFQDVVSFGLIAGRKALEIIKNVNYIYSFELMCACQAAGYRGPEHLSPVTMKLFEKIRTIVPHIETDEVLTDFLEDIQKVLEDGTFLKVAEDFLAKEGKSLWLTDKSGGKDE